jgi:hypothetical protein
LHLPPYEGDSGGDLTAEHLSRLVIMGSIIGKAGYGVVHVLGISPEAQRDEPFGQRLQGPLAMLSDVLVTGGIAREFVVFIATVEPIGSG